LKITLKNGSMVLRKVCAITTKCLIPGLKSVHHDTVESGVKKFKKGYRQLLSICEYVLQQKRMRDVHPLRILMYFEHFVEIMQRNLPDEKYIIQPLERDIHGKSLRRIVISSQPPPAPIGGSDQSSPKGSMEFRVPSPDSSLTDDTELQQYSPDDVSDPDDDIELPFNKFIKGQQHHGSDDNYD